MHVTDDTTNWSDDVCQAEKGDGVGFIDAEQRKSAEAINLRSIWSSLEFNEWKHKIDINALGVIWVEQRTIPGTTVCAHYNSQQLFAFASGPQRLYFCCSICVARQRRLIPSENMFSLFQPLHSVKHTHRPLPPYHCEPSSFIVAVDCRVDLSLSLCVLSLHKSIIYYRFFPPSSPAS